MRQTLAAAVRYGYLATNPAVLAGVNPAPAPRAVRVYAADELTALEQELGPRFGPLAAFAAETGLRPSEWATLERRHVDRARRVLTVNGTKTRGSRREVPLTLRAIAALDRSPAGSTRRSCSLPIAAACSISTTGAGGPGLLQSSRRASLVPQGSTIYARRSRAGHSQPGSLRSSSPAS